jgi:DnaJ-domain-containing protein 1
MGVSVRAGSEPSEQTWKRLWWAAQLPSQRGILAVAPKRILALLAAAEPARC